MLPSAGRHDHRAVLQLLAGHLHRAPLVILLPRAQLQVGAHTPAVHVALVSDSEADGRSARHSAGRAQAWHRRGLALLLRPLAQAQAAVLCPAQTVHASFTVQAESVMLASREVHPGGGRVLKAGKFDRRKTCLDTFSTWKYEHRRAK